MLKTLYSRIDEYISSGYSFSLADQTGLCVLFANRYKHTGEEEDIDKCSFFLNNLLETQQYTTASLPFGLSGMIWCLKHLEKLELLELTEEETKAAEQSLFSKIEPALGANNWDYYRGATGYLIALDQPEAYRLWIDYMKLHIKKNSSGGYELHSTSYRESTNMGLHVGILGVWAVCNKLQKKDIYGEEAGEIRKRILDIVLQKLDETNYQYYPALYEREYAARMCWTYGELTLAYLLVKTGTMLNVTHLTEAGKKVLSIANSRDTLDDTMIQDSCLISGSSGNFLLYKELNRYIPSALVEQKKRMWSDYTKFLLTRTNYLNIDRYTQKPVIDLSILGGLSGIVLAHEEFGRDWMEYILLE